MISLTSSLPAEAITMVTAGLTCPPDTECINKITRARDAPIANGFPVATMTYTKTWFPRIRLNNYTLLYMYSAKKCRAKSILYFPLYRSWSSRFFIG